MQKTILLADDDIDDTTIFCEALQLIDPTIICRCASDGQEAIDILANEESPDIIFLDINMPRMNGWECLERIRDMADCKHIPVLVYSTSTHPRDINAALDLGALCFFAKPNNFQELKSILEVVTDNLNSDLLQAISHFNNIKSKRVFSCSEES
jgi:CheY-like chemotaxis protein